MFEIAISIFASIGIVFTSATFLTGLFYLIDKSITSRANKGQARLDDEYKKAKMETDISYITTSLAGMNRAMHERFDVVEELIAKKGKK